MCLSRVNVASTGVDAALCVNAGPSRVYVKLDQRGSRATLTRARVNVGFWVVLMWVRINVGRAVTLTWGRVNASRVVTLTWALVNADRAATLTWAELNRHFLQRTSSTPLYSSTAH